MPPDRTFPPQSPPRTPSQDTSHMLPRVSATEDGGVEHSSPSPHSGPNIWRIARVLIVLLILVFGGLYFWGAYLNEQSANGPQSVAPAANT